MSRYLAKNLQGKQKNWNVATQNRKAMTTSMLASMKSLRMLGFIPYTESLIQNLRLQELAMAKKRDEAAPKLDVETAFTATALLGFATHPANMIMTIVPQAIGALAAFDRVQQYLLELARTDERLVLRKIDDIHVKDRPATRMDNVAIGSASSSPPILTDIIFDVKRGYIVMCSGTVGSGKTTLVKAIIGEISPTAGTIRVSAKRMGFCGQTPWLPNGTLKIAICSCSPMDSVWYEEVVRLCSLDEDITALPQGDQTIIGSRGLNLSGGQRQRVALARGVYARCDIVVLDDTFSALDGRKENSIIENLLNAHGLFRSLETTVFIVTKTSARFYLADWLVVPGDNSVKYQGSWDDLTTKPEQIRKSYLSEPGHREANEQVHVDSNVKVRH
ncbi:hypothetical protein MMC25_001527 [Agyrium rufum]|nr:hypothetical protein [Agyrium rufum]